MLSPTAGVPLDNKLLSALPRDQLDLLAPHMSTSNLAQGFVVLESGDEFDQVYFPHNGMLSLLTVMRDGKAIEVATVGREGVVGAMAGLGLYKSSARVVVQLPLSVTRIAASQFRKIVDNSNSVRNLCLHYNEVLLLQARVTVACNALHPVESRFCRWLLQSADRAESIRCSSRRNFWPRCSVCAARRSRKLPAKSRSWAPSPIRAVTSQSSIVTHWRAFPASAIRSCSSIKSAGKSDRS